LSETRLFVSESMDGLSETRGILSERKLSLSETQVTLGERVTDKRTRTVKTQIAKGLLIEPVPFISHSSSSNFQTTNQSAASALISP
jgi:hypothetical protein